MFGNEIFPMAWAAWLQCSSVDSRQFPIPGIEPDPRTVLGCFYQPWDLGADTKDPRDPSWVCLQH